MTYAKQTTAEMEALRRRNRGQPEDLEAGLARLEALARLMDSIVRIPGTEVRIGVDALIGLIPVVGDLASQVVSSYLIWEARQLGASRLVIARMIANSAIDTLLGAVPVAGDAFDVMFRANLKNIALLRAHLEKTGKLRPKVIDAEYSRVA